MFFGKRYARPLFLLLLLACGSFFALARIIFAEGNTTEGSQEEAILLISEIQIGGAAAGDEFIELYNPNPYEVSLEGWSLGRIAKTGKENPLLTDIGTWVNPTNGTRDDSENILKISAGGYFLIAPRYVCGAEDERCYSGEGEAEADSYYSRKDFLAPDNSLILYDGERAVDKVGWGEAADFEGSPYLPEGAGGKNFARLRVGEALADTGDNSRDFSAVDTPSPQNAAGRRVAAGAENAERPGELPAPGEELADVAAPGEEESGQEKDEEKEAAAPLSESGKEVSEAADIAPVAEKSGTTSGAASVPEERRIIITEFLVSPTGDDRQAEFIELYNAGSTAADIGGWKLKDRTGRIGNYVFPSGTKLKAGEYRAFYSAVTGISLNNSGDGAVLWDEKENIVFTAPLCSEAEEDTAFAEVGSAWFWTLTPTPGSRNILKAKAEGQDSGEKAEGSGGKLSDTLAGEIADESKAEPMPVAEYDFADGLILSEIFPDPAGRDNQAENFEWVEIYNDSDREVDLRGWCLDDVRGKGSKEFCFPQSTLIAPRSYRVLANSESGLALNNAEEEMNLLWPDKRVVDSVAYAKAKEGCSYGLDREGDWEWSEQATPGAENIWPSENGAAGSGSVSGDQHGGESRGKAQEDGEVLAAFEMVEEGEGFLPIAQVKDLPSGSVAGIGGLVSAPYGVLGKDFLYLADKDTGDGIRVAGSAEVLSLFLLGDEVRLGGKVGEAGGEKRLLCIGGAEEVSRDNLLFSAALDFGKLAESLGSLVMLEGEAGMVTDGALFYLRTAEGEMKVYAEPETGISFADIKAGDLLSVTGVLSRTSLGYRILPRFRSDIRFLDKADGGIIEKSNAAAAEKEDGIPDFRASLFLGAGLLLLVRWKPARVKALWGRLRAGRGGGKTINS